MNFMGRKGFTYFNVGIVVFKCCFLTICNWCYKDFLLEYSFHLFLSYIFKRFSCASDNFYICLLWIIDQKRKVYVIVGKILFLMLFYSSLQIMIERFYCFNLLRGFFS